MANHDESQKCVSIPAGMTHEFFLAADRVGINRELVDRLIKNSDLFLDVARFLKIGIAVCPIPPKIPKDQNPQEWLSFHEERVIHFLRACGTLNVWLRNHTDIVKRDHPFPSGSAIWGNWRSNLPEDVELGFSGRFCRLNLHGMNFSDIGMAEIHMSHSELLRANFTNCYLRSSRFESALLEFAVMDKADLTFAKMNGAKLGKASLKNTNLGSAEFIGADLNECNLEGANMDQTNLRDADLLFAKGLTRKQLSMTINKPRTVPIHLCS